jgi:beta-glucosidase-like glycosyl hydrolase
MTATVPVRTPTRATDRQELSSRLLGSAAKTSFDPTVDVDRDAPIPDDLYGLSPEWSSLYGTPLLEGLTEQWRVR